MNIDNPCTSSLRFELDAYLYNDLDPNLFQQVSAHLKECADCRHYVEDLQTALSRIPTAQASVSTQDVQRLQARITSKLSRSHSWWPTLATSVCALALLVVYFSQPAATPHQTATSGEMLHELEVLEHFEMLQSLDMLEDLELLEALETHG